MRLTVNLDSSFEFFQEDQSNGTFENYKIRDFFYPYYSLDLFKTLTTSSFGQAKIHT